MFSRLLPSLKSVCSPVKPSPLPVLLIFNAFLIVTTSIYSLCISVSLPFLYSNSSPFNTLSYAPQFSPSLSPSQCSPCFRLFPLSISPCFPAMLLPHGTGITTRCVTYTSRDVYMCIYTMPCAADTHRIRIHNDSVTWHTNQPIITGRWVTWQHITNHRLLRDKCSQSITVQ